MKKILLLLFLLTSPVVISKVFAQTYTTESKSCGSCNKEVSKNSKIGMRCPHCGVRWGYENESKSTRYNYSTSPNYSGYNSTDYTSYKSVGFTNSRVNMRSKPTTKSSIVTVIPQYTSLTVIDKVGKWYLVEFVNFRNGSFETIRGYVYETLI